MKQTAVEWLVKKFMTENTTREGWHEIFEQAKEMEKNQIIEACKYGNSFEKGDLRCDVYYNKTYKNTDK